MHASADETMMIALYEQIVDLQVCSLPFLMLSGLSHLCTIQSCIIAGRVVRQIKLRKVDLVDTADMEAGSD